MAGREHAVLAPRLGKSGPFVGMCSGGRGPRAALSRARRFARFLAHCSLPARGIVCRSGGGWVDWLEVSREVWSACFFVDPLFRTRL